MKTGFMVSIVTALALASMVATAAAQEYPRRNVTIIVPYPAGGPTDETARMVAQSLSFPTADSFLLMFGPKLDVVYWQAMFAPAGTPASIIGTLNKALQNAVSDPALVKIWSAQDVSVFAPDQRSPAAASALLNSEIARWGQVIRDNKIHIQQ